MLKTVQQKWNKHFNELTVFFLINLHFRSDQWRHRPKDQLLILSSQSPYLPSLSKPKTVCPDCHSNTTPHKHKDTDNTHTSCRALMHDTLHPATSAVSLTDILSANCRSPDESHHLAQNTNNMLQTHTHIHTDIDAQISFSADHQGRVYHPVLSAPSHFHLLLPSPS